MNWLFIHTGGRRFFLVLLTFITTSILLWYGKLASADYQWITMGIVATYVAGNVTQRIKTPNENTPQKN